jgi:hypothetical protein
MQLRSASVITTSSSRPLHSSATIETPPSLPPPLTPPRLVDNTSTLQLNTIAKYNPATFITTPPPSRPLPPLPPRPFSLFTTPPLPLSTTGNSSAIQANTIASYNPATFITTPPPARPPPPSSPRPFGLSFSTSQSEITGTYHPTPFTTPPHPLPSLPLSESNSSSSNGTINLNKYENTPKIRPRWVLPPSHSQRGPGARETKLSTGFFSPNDSSQNKDIRIQASKTLHAIVNYIVTPIPLQEEHSRVTLLLSHTTTDQMHFLVAAKDSCLPRFMDFQKDHPLTIEFKDLLLSVMNRKPNMEKLAKMEKSFRLMLGHVTAVPNPEDMANKLRNCMVRNTLTPHSIIYIKQICLKQNWASRHIAFQRRVT